MEREPAIRRKGRGYCIRWGGKDHYLSADLALAERLWADPRSRHPGSRAAWRLWQTGKSATPRRNSHMTVAELAEQFLLALAPQKLRGYRCDLARFLNAHGRAAVRTLTVPGPDHFQPPLIPLLIALREDMLASGLYRAPTINHDLRAVQRLFRWGAEMGLCPEVSFKSVRKLRERRADPDDLPITGLKLMLRVIDRIEPDLADVLRLQYLTATRVSEVVKIIVAADDLRRRGQSALGRYVPVVDAHGALIHAQGSLELLKHKTLHHGHERRILLSDEALVILARCRPRWKSQSGLTHAAEKCGLVGGPRTMRDSAATHLRALGVDQGDVDRLLGHAPSGVLHSYARIPWHILRERVAALTLR